MDLLLEEDWNQMKFGEAEIGWMHKKFITLDKQQLNSEIQSEEESKHNKNELNNFISDGFLKMNEGKMTINQINLLFQTMPFDVTFVDENDRVLFYNRGEDRVFPRSAGVIGREVRFCHPPKSVATVLKILEEFKAGRKSEAEFWINFKSRLIHIRYFAVRDEYKQYKGVIEISQDITEIKKIVGERRLLNWDH